MATYSGAEDGPDLEDLDRVERVFKRWLDAKDGLADWREEARECYAFVAGDQWDPDDIAKLQEEQRPCITFNRLGVMIDAICGLEVTNRMAIQYYPREQGDVQVVELESAAVAWVREQCHGEDEESEAFRDSSICGIGVTETRMDYDQDPDGMIVIERRDPLKTFYDPASSKKCLEDARYVFHADWMDNKEIETTWGEDKFSASTPWDGLQTDQRPQNADLQFLYKDESADGEKHKDQSLVLQYQCWTRETFYRVLDPETGELVSFDKDKFSKIRAAYREATGQDLKHVKQQKKVFWRAFYVGKTELEWEKSPYQEGFTFKFITARRDRNKRMWYGAVRAMIDPQRWANKWLSQILHIINTNAKGGAFVEENALRDPRKAEEQWGASNPLITLNEGGISKIKERTPAPTPPGLDKLMSFAFESLPFVSGINLESLGLANREQAGVLEEQRRKSAFGILSPLFDSLRLYRKHQGRMLLYYIRTYISDGRLVRVIGQNGDPKYLPLLRKKDAAEYDIIVDQSPTSPDYKEKTWEAMQNLIPAMLKAGAPLPPSLFDFAPIPSRVAAEWKDLMLKAQQGGNPQAMQEHMKQMQQQLQKAGQQLQQLNGENQSLKADRAVQHEANMVKRQDAQERNATKDLEVRLNAQIQDLTLKVNAQIDAFAALQKASADHAKNRIDASDKAHKNAISEKHGTEANRIKEKQVDKPQPKATK